MKIMPPSSDNHDAHDYAERICERLPRRLQELREAAGMSKYGIAWESGISREYIGKIERGKANPTLPVTAQLSHGIGMSLTEFVEQLKDEAACEASGAAAFCFDRHAGALFGIDAGPVLRSALV